MAAERTSDSSGRSVQRVGEPSSGGASFPPTLAAQLRPTRVVLRSSVEPERLQAQAGIVAGVLKRQGGDQFPRAFGNVRLPTASAAGQAARHRLLNARGERTIVVRIGSSLARAKRDFVVSRACNSGSMGKERRSWVTKQRRSSSRSDASAFLSSIRSAMRKVLICSAQGVASARGSFSSSTMTAISYSLNETATYCPSAE